MQKLLAITLTLGTLAVVGCDPAPLYVDPRNQVIQRVTPRSEWRAGGSLRDSAYAIDGDIGSMAVSQQGAASGELTIDLGRSCLFNMIVIDHGRNEHGYSQRITVLTSLDGRTYTQRYQAVGTRRVSIFSLMTPTLARFVRLRADGIGQSPWSVAEVHLQ